MTDASLFVYAYDVTDDRERRQVDAVLRGYGFRRQKSVFECRLTRGHEVRLKKELAALELRTGSVVIYQVAPNARVETIGDAPHFPDDDWAWIA